MARRSFPAEREGLGEHLIQGPALFHLGARSSAASFREIGVCQRFHPRFEGVDLTDRRKKLAQRALVLGADDLLDEGVDHRWFSLRGRGASRSYSLTRREARVILGVLKTRQRYSRMNFRGFSGIPLMRTS